MQAMNDNQRELYYIAIDPERTTHFCIGLSVYLYRLNIKWGAAVIVAFVIGYLLGRM